MLIAAGCLFVAGVLPMLGWTRFLFQMYSTTADHYLYLAMLGPALALAWIIQRWHRPAVHLLAALLLVVLGIRTMAQGRHWANDYPLFSHALRVNPQSFAALTNLGSAYYADGRLEEAERHFRAAIALREDLVHARENLANVLALQGRVDEAIEQIRAALRIRESQPPDVAGDFSDTYFHVAQLLIRRGRYQEAIDELDRLLRQQPDHAEAQEARALAQQRLESGAKLSAKSLPGAT